MSRVSEWSFVILFWVALFSWACSSSGTDTKGDSDASEDIVSDTEGDGDTKEPPPSEDPCPAGFPAGGDLTQGSYEGFEVGGVARSFYLMPPEGPAPAEGFPLFVAFHGTGQSPTAMHMPFEPLRSELDMVIVAPADASQGSIWPVWDDMRLPGDERPNRDLEFVDQILECLGDRFSLRQDAIFAGGFSAGGAMTHRVLRQRPEVFSGGIPMSGAYELTGTGIGELHDEDQVVIITWGGDDDRFGVGGGGVFYFNEQAALASQVYEQAPNIDQYHCRGEDLGHSMLAREDLIVWAGKTLLEGVGGEAPSPIEDPGFATCTSAVADLPQPGFPSPQCSSAQEPHCESYCQQFGDCMLNNATVGPIARPFLASLGITTEACVECPEGCDDCGEDCSDECEVCDQDCEELVSASCEDCITRCEDFVGADSAERDVLECMTPSEGPRQCVSGIKTTLPLAADIGSCCATYGDSQICADICAKIDPQSVMAAIFSFCES